MKTPEEIKIGLACEETCFNCPYFKDSKSIADCIERVQNDALAYINQLEETISLMMIQMRGDCGCCKHGKDMAWCNRCLTSRGDYHPLWEYEGLPEVKKDDKPM